jgi:hypothetical protein
MRTRSIRKPNQHTKDNGMDLPKGMMCGHCHWYQRCKWLISANVSDRVCDWAPSRFECQRPTAKQGG